MKAPLSHRTCTARVSIVIRAPELLRQPVGNGQTRLESGLKVATTLGLLLGPLGCREDLPKGPKSLQEMASRGPITTLG